MANNDSKIYNQIFNSTMNENDKMFVKEMNKMFGNALSAKGLNLLDPIYSNMFYYNKMSMRGNVDYPRVTRTYVFFTRPELNFSMENIASVPFFKWLYAKPIGKMIMASLTDPEYFINAPSLFNTLDQNNMNKVYEAINNYSKEIKTTTDNIANTDNALSEALVSKAANYDPDSNNGTNSNNSNDNAKEVQDLLDMNIDILADSTASLEALKDYSNIVKGAYGKSLSYYDNKLADIHAKMENILKTKEDSYTNYLHSKNLYQAKNIFSKLYEGDDKFNFTSPFIPLLQNTCTSLNGAKDFNLEQFTYEEDEFGGTQSVPTGMDSVFSGADLSLNFEDIAYGPVSLMLLTWVLYIHYVSRGYIATSRDHVVERILDYTCSIYVFVIGDDGKRIERWAKYTGCYPTTFPLSSQLDHNVNVDTEALQKISVNFHCNRYEPMNPEIFTDFNFLSETEWLVKLREPLWEELYKRKKVGEFNREDYDMLNYEALLLKNTGKRPIGLWTPIKDFNRGMSGKLPPTLIDGTTTNLINNYWGGYPYIVNGTDLIWIQPKFDINKETTGDTIKDNGST